MSGSWRFAKWKKMIPPDIGSTLSWDNKYYSGSEGEIAKKA